MIDDGYVTNLYTEVISIVLTVGVIDFLSRRREEKREETQKLKTRLRKLMRSPSNEITSKAIDELRQHGWLEDGWLGGVYFSYANLQNVDLSKADMQGARLTSANASGANFEYANLQDTSLAKARLQGAILRHSDLQGTKLQTAEYNQTTILPDGHQWTVTTDMARFADPEHPDFWRSDPESPAHREEPGGTL